MDVFGFIVIFVLHLQCFPVLTNEYDVMSKRVGDRGLDTIVSFVVWEEGSANKSSRVVYRLLTLQLPLPRLITAMYFTPRFPQSSLPHSVQVQFPFMTPDTRRRAEQSGAGRGSTPVGLLGGFGQSPLFPPTLRIKSTLPALKRYLRYIYDSPELMSCWNATSDVTFDYHCNVVRLICQFILKNVKA